MPLCSQLRRCQASKGMPPPPRREGGVCYILCKEVQTQSTAQFELATSPSPYVPPERPPTRRGTRRDCRYDFPPETGPERGSLCVKVCVFPMTQSCSALVRHRDAVMEISHRTEVEGMKTHLLKPLIPIRPCTLRHCALKPGAANKVVSRAGSLIQEKSEQARAAS
ncbi:hypothetical protein SKAU_G00081720 [Synaphobranchus kaupii]|uniref:Uncharacterized protein n=1 Tax=Synaphobranchus kaupii TaxID=118154 RepID=A0A9Q1FVG9_SYNKA|nr:hypothetical protein SKAU_G00081720 [Synaphobranchus kaupii]